MKRHICYISGTRADFGLMQKTLQAIHQADDLKLSILATGMHLDDKCGNTIDDIKASGLELTVQIPLSKVGTVTGATMVGGIAEMLSGMAPALENLSPDLVLLLGDRGEMLAAAIAALHLNIPIAHIHGGERSGTIDESVRHAISKFAHFHFVATEKSRERLIQMGERRELIWVTGAPGLDGLLGSALVTRNKLFDDVGIDRNRRVALLIFHPVVQEADTAGKDLSVIINSLLDQDLQIIALRPNSDVGSTAINDALDSWAEHPSIRVLTHFPRELFLSWMAVADIMVGNSSSGIIEAASFGTPAINLGSRQNLRERNKNVIDAAIQSDVIAIAINKAFKVGRFEARNIYGDGHAAERIIKHLRTITLHPGVLNKINEY
jgi:GDP/UDP-N,N'-diacetylbacillosamine 2-epimerase (hydrolysing)